MKLTPEQQDQIVAEVKRFSADLQLSADQKEKLQTSMVEARTKLSDYLKEHPNTTKADIVKEVAAHRDQIRQRVVNFLSPEQLKKWDAETAKAKEFLGQKLAA
jgi:predicted HTH transcriptional regulator